MINWKKLSLTTIVLLISAAFGYLYIWEKPKLESWVKNYIESISEDPRFPVQVKIESANISILPIQIEIKNSHIAIKGDLTKTLKDFQIESVKIKPSILDIIMGKYWVQLLDISGAGLNVDISHMESSSEESFLDKFQIDKLLSQIPLSELRIQNIALNLKLTKDETLNTKSLNLSAYNEKSSLILSIKEPSLTYKNSKSEISALLESQLMLTKNTLSIAKLKIVKDESYFIASGNLIYQKSLQHITDGNFKTRLNTHFQDFYQWTKPFKDITEIKDLRGALKADVQISKEKNKKYDLYIQSDITELGFGKLNLGKVTTRAEIKDQKTLKIEQIVAYLPGKNRVTLENGKVELVDNKTFSADLKIDKLQIHSLLRDMKIATIPVWIDAEGTLNCTGDFKTSLQISCPGALVGKRLKVMNGSQSKTIVGTERVDLAGTIDITESSINYSAKAQIKDSKATSKGTISYKKGFNIDYESDGFYFKDIGPIADLKFSGHGKTKGNTQGDSDAATFTMDVTADNFEFEGYFFGQLESRMSYKKGVLDLNQLQGDVESTRYSGNLSVDLIKDNIKGDLQLPFFRMEDIQQIVLQKVNLENRFLGSGSGRLQIDTPFEVNQLGFNFEGRMFKGAIFGEEYNEAEIKAQAVDGIIILQKAVFQKEKTIANIRGTISTELETQVELNISQGQLQQSYNLKNFNLPLQGEFQAFGRIKGKLTKPILFVEAKVDNLLWNKKSYGETRFTYDNSKSHMQVQLDLKNQLNLILIHPEEASNNYFINLNSSRFDIAPFLSYMVSDETTRNYSMPLTGELSGTVNTKDFWLSEFSSTISELTFDYRTNRITTTLPTNIELKNEQIFLNEISMIGDRQFLKVTQPNTKKRQTRLVVNSQINISFFKLFAPFIEKVDGLSTIRLELGVIDHDIKIIGSATLNDSYLKFPGFPHAFENLSADVLFNQNKVLINSITGELASGKVIGNGEVTIGSDKKLNLLLQTQVQGTQIEFPKGFKTTGDAQIKLTGSGQPYNLSGTYNIKKGLIESNFGGSGGATSSNLLEGLLRDDAASPLTLDLAIQIDKSVEVKNSLVEGYVLGQFKVFDKITSPRIKGEAQFERDSIIRFRENEFRVIQSSFLFEGENPINPKLSMRAKTRLNNYDVELFLHGRAQKPILAASSQPPLPENQIISMLAFGTIPNQFDQSGTTLENGNNSGFEIGTSILENNPLGRELRERYDVDVQFSSSFDDQNNTAVPKVTVRKKMRKNLIISVSQTTGNTSQSEGRVTYELNNQLSTIFRVTNGNTDVNNLNNNIPTRQNNPFGIDLEYKREFD